MKPTGGTSAVPLEKVTLPHTIHSSLASNFLIPPPCASISHFVHFSWASFYWLDGLLPNSELSSKANTIFKMHSVEFCYLTLFNDDSLVVPLQQGFPSSRHLRHAGGASGRCVQCDRHSPLSECGDSRGSGPACRLHPRGKGSSKFPSHVCKPPRLQNSRLWPWQTLDAARRHQLILWDDKARKGG